MKYEAVVVGVSAGGMDALTVLLSGLRGVLPVPMLVVQHMHEDADEFFVNYLARKSGLPVREAEDKTVPEAGVVYLAPPGYHLLVEEDKVLSLSVDPRVSGARPSIDVLFESAAVVWGDELIGLIMTGAANDGCNGLLAVKQAGGLCVVQEPSTCEAPYLPEAAIRRVRVDQVLALDAIAPFLLATLEQKS